MTLDTIQSFTLIGSPDEIQSKVANHVEAGVGHFEVRFVYHSIPHLLEQMELFGNEVIASA